MTVVSLPRNDVASLSPPPRLVPGDLRCELLSHTAFCVGGILLAIVVVVAPLITQGWTKEYRLLWGTHEAPGQVIFSRPTYATENRRRIYCHEYSFRLPDGRRVQGRSFSVHGPMPRSRTVSVEHVPQSVVVEYLPRRPNISRIKGMAAGTGGLSAPLVILVFALVGIALMAGATARGLRRIRLLRFGELAWAEIQEVKAKQERRKGPFLPVPFEQFKQTWWGPASQAPRGFSERPTDAAGPLPIRRVPASFGIAFGFFRLICWMMLVFGVAFFGFCWWEIYKGVPVHFESGTMDPRVASLFVGGLLLFWVIFLVFALRMLRRFQAMVRGTAAPATIQSHPEFSCTFAFALPDGQVVEAEDSVVFSRELVGQAQLRVLYDPVCPTRAFLLDGQSLPVQVSPAGEWDVPYRARPVLRLALTLLCVAISPLIAWAVATLLYHE